MLAIVLTTSACSSNGPAEGCDSSCDPHGGFAIEIPDDACDEVVIDIELTGEACATSQAQCVRKGRWGCTDYAVLVTAEGVCHVVVQFGDGLPSYAADVSFVHRDTGTCCDGFYAQGPDAVVVPGRVDAGADAMVDGG